MIVIKSCTHGSKGPGSYGPSNKQPLFLCHSPKKDVRFENMILTHSCDFFQGCLSPKFELNPHFKKTLWIRLSKSPGNKLIHSVRYSRHLSLTCNKSLCSIAPFPQPSPLCEDATGPAGQAGPSCPDLWGSFLLQCKACRRQVVQEFEVPKKTALLQFLCTQQSSVQDTEN